MAVLPMDVKAVQHHALVLRELRQGAVHLLHLPPGDLQIFLELVPFGDVGQQQVLPVILAAGDHVAIGIGCPQARKGQFQRPDPLGDILEGCSLVLQIPEPRNDPVGVFHSPASLLSSRLSFWIR